MRQAMIETFDSLGWRVSTSDLYQMKFKASADEDDFLERHNLNYFDLQVEQKMAFQNQTFSPDIRREQQALSAADLIIFQFPLWWESMPALMKGYIDRVFSMGWAYNGIQALAGKSALVCMTTGAPQMAWASDKRGTIQEVFKHLFVGTIEHCEMQLLDPFVAYGAKRMTDDEKAQMLEKLKSHLATICANISNASKLSSLSS